MSERTLYEFSIDSANYYDGSRHTIIQSNCTLTNERLIIRDARGRTQQINLRTISSVTPRIGLVNKDLELKMGTTSTLVIYGKKDQLLDIARMINEARATPSYLQRERYLNQLAKSIRKRQHPQQATLQLAIAFVCSRPFYENIAGSPF